MASVPRQEPLRDVDLWLRAKTDPAAMEQLILGCGGFIESCRQKYLGDDQIAALGWDREDAWQEAAMGFVRAVRQFDPRRGPPAHLAALAIRHALWMQWRKARCRAEAVSLQDLVYSGADGATLRAEEILAAPEPEYTAVDRLALAQAWGCLAAHQREALRLHFVDGLTFAAIAQRHGLSYVTWVRRKDRGLAALRTALLASAS